MANLSWREEMAFKHYLKYCTSEKCIRGPEHQKKANWHEGFCLECVFNPYNMKVLYKINRKQTGEPTEDK